MTNVYTYNRLGRTTFCEELGLTLKEKEAVYKQDALDAIERLRGFDRAGKDKLIAAMAKGSVNHVQHCK